MNSYNRSNEERAIEFRIELRSSGAHSSQTLKLRLDSRRYEEQFKSFVEANELSSQQTEAIRSAIEETVADWHKRSMSIQASTTNVLKELDNQSDEDSHSDDVQIPVQPAYQMQHPHTPFVVQQTLVQQTTISTKHLPKPTIESQVLTTTRYVREQRHNQPEMPQQTRTPTKCILLKDHQFQPPSRRQDRPKKTPQYSHNKLRTEPTAAKSNKQTSPQPTRKVPAAKPYVRPYRPQPPMQPPAPQQVWENKHEKERRSPRPAEHFYRPAHEDCKQHKCSVWEKSVEPKPQKDTRKPRPADQFYRSGELTPERCRLHQCDVWKYNTNNGARKQPIVTLQYSPAKEGWPKTLRNGDSFALPSKKPPPLAKYLPDSTLSSFYKNFELACSAVNR